MMKLPPPGHTLIPADLRQQRPEVRAHVECPVVLGPSVHRDPLTLAIAERAPQSLDDLQGLSGIGAKKLEAYGDEVLRVMESV